MLFTLVAALAASRSAAMRPELSNRVGLARSSVSQNLARLGELVSDASKTTEGLGSLRSATQILDGILAQNATEHISDDEASLLHSVIELVEKTIYVSMDSAQVADLAALDDGVAAVALCNTDITARQAPTGDLGRLHKITLDRQTELNRLQGEVDDAISANATEWETFDNYMQMINNPPACPDFPARTMPRLDVYFAESEYSTWYSHQQDAYENAKGKYLDADAALTAAIEAFNLQRVLRDVEYCDWRVALEAACASFDQCYEEKSNDFNKVIVPRVQGDMNDRIEIFKAGETIIHQVNFLLGKASSQETPAIDTSRYELIFPQLPPKGECNTEILESSVWVPTVECGLEHTECPGLHETTCSTRLNWHHSISVRTDAVKRCTPGWARTSGGTCKQWCGDGGYECLRGQDSHGGRCTLYPEHTRQTTEDNGCLQKWGDQVCECGLTAPPTLPTPRHSDPSFERLDIMNFDGRTRITLPQSAHSQGNAPRSMAVWLRNGRDGNANARLGWTIFGQGVHETNKMWVVCARNDAHGMGVWGHFSDLWLEKGNDKWEYLEWHHLAVTWDGADLIIYYDGEVLGEIGPNTAWNRKTATFDTDGSVAYFGGGVQAVGGNPHMKYFKGQATALRIWSDEAIDQKAVKAWMNAEKEQLPK